MTMESVEVVASWRVIGCASWLVRKEIFIVDFLKVAMHFLVGNINLNHYFKHTLEAKSERSTVWIIWQQNTEVKTFNEVH